MIGYTVTVFIFVYAFVMLLSSRYFYLLELRNHSRKKLRSLELNLEELDFSFEQMVYFVSLPSNLPIIKQAKQKDITIKIDYSSLVFPTVSGINIIIKTDTDNMTLAYLPIKDFRLPKLDQLLAKRKLNEKSYIKISTYKLIHKKTLQLIAEDVYNQLQVGRNNISSSKM
ncbi:hypothetical protein EJF36_04870 [Bacillus sp. HMF5848]|uniref:hypothetical protein n=1 Tax=Bacillus sp. HMF5848 TaxID=2495421 RepID=UPI000F7A2B7D|nr:hypothetical protein [Bacillus sp. HMF5848]RSK26241.1 hypothetical protein EJF36_04870 [Bacillus sp. HMF5848]